MTTDDFTTAAIRKAGEWFPGHPGDSIGQRTTGWAEDTVLMVAEWARTYLAEQEPTDAEVEAAAEAAFLSTGSLAVGGVSQWADAYEYQRDRWRTRARAALAAARALCGTS